jgi:uncharacterized protein
MIKNYYVENFLSIKDKMEINFEASSLKDDTFYNDYFYYENYKILKVVSFYGMNASGKSNIIKSFAALRELVVPLLPNNPLPYTPFAFCDIKNKPISFGIEFSLDNEESTIFKYFVKYDASKILFERLEKLTSQKFSLIFERKIDTDNSINVVFGSNVSNIQLLNALKVSIKPDKTFLSMFANFEIDDLSDAYAFFANRLINITPVFDSNFNAFPKTENIDEKLKEFTIKLLNAADFNINDFHIEKNKRDINQNIPFIIQPSNLLYFDHKVGNKKYSLEFTNESLGTRKILILSEFLYRVLSMPSVLIVDELESSFHPDLTKFIIQCFLDENINTFNSQLIFSSHEVSLLDLNLFRREQINFVYKDSEKCSTYIRSLSDFHLRSSENLEKAYVVGRFNTSPNIDSLEMRSK